MLGLLCVIGLWAPNADIPLIEAAVAQVKAGRADEALRLLAPISGDADRVQALPRPDQLLLFYTLGRAYEEGGDGCAAHDAFSRARQTGRLRRRERRRLDTALTRVADLRGASVAVACADVAEIAGERRRCPFVTRDLPPDAPVRVRFWLGDFAYPAVEVRAARCATARVRMPPSGRLIVAGAASARINDVRVTLPAQLEVPPGRYRIEGGGERRVIQVEPDATARVRLGVAGVAVEPPASSSVLPWVVTGVLAAGAAGTGLMALSKGDAHAQAEADVNAGRSTDRAAVFALEDETNAYAVTALALTLATAGAAVWALWPSDPGDRAELTPGGVRWRF